MERYWLGKLEVLKEKPVLLPLCLPQIPHRWLGTEPRPQNGTLVTESWYGKCLQKTGLINVGVPMDFVCSCYRIIYKLLVLMYLSYEITFLLCYILSCI